MAQYDIPSVINHYNAYYGAAEELIGQSGEVELPDFEAITDTIDGGGILGEFEDPVTGHFESMEVTVPFAVLYKSQFDLINTTDPPMLTFRGSEQVINKSTGNTDYVPVRVIIKGKAKTNKLGKLSRGKKGEPEITMEVLYIKVEVDGETMVELDKLNFRFIVNGVDLMEKVRSQC